MEPRELVDGRVEARDRREDGRAENARPRDRFGQPLAYGMPDQLVGREDPGDVVATVAQALERARELFAEQRFFEAHEFFEWAWKADEVSAADKPFWKGVAQAAVGCCHAQRGNAKGAVTLLRRAARAVEPYPPQHEGVATQRLVEAVCGVVAQIAARGPSPDLDFPAFPRAA